MSKNPSEFDALLDKVVEAHEHYTGEQPNTTEFAEIKAVVRDEISKEQR